MVVEKDQVKTADSLPDPFIRDDKGNITGAKLTIEGKEVEINSTKELLELAQKGKDYTQKTQELSEEKKKIQEQIQSKAEELALQYIEELQTKSPEAKPDDTLDPQEKRILQLEEKLANLEKGSEERSIAQYELKFETELKELKGKYPSLDERVVLATMMANPDLDMEDVAKENHETKTKERDDIIKKYLEDKKKQPKTDGGGSRSIPSSQEKPLSGKDLSTGMVRKIATEHIRQELEQE